MTYMQTQNRPTRVSWGNPDSRLWGGWVQPETHHCSHGKAVVARPALGLQPALMSTQPYKLVSKLPAACGSSFPETHPQLDCCLQASTQPYKLVSKLPAACGPCSQKYTFSKAAAFQTRAEGFSVADHVSNFSPQTSFEEKQVCHKTGLPLNFKTDSKQVGGPDMTDDRAAAREPV